MKIVVDANEVRSGLVDVLSSIWDHVEVRRLPAGDVAVGENVLVERKTTADFAASLNDGRLFRQARHLVATVSRPVLVQEGDPDDLRRRIDTGAFRGAILALTVGFRIPVLQTRDVRDTARLLRHLAAQESRRASRRRRREVASNRGQAELQGKATHRLPRAAFDVLLALPHVGPTRAASLAAHLRSLGDLGRLTIRDLMRIRGIGPDTAARIVDTVRGR